MKKKILLIAIGITCLSPLGFGQFTFGVSPGLSLNGTNFGYRFCDHLIFNFGFQYMNAKFQYDESGEIFDFNQGMIVPYKDATDFKGNLVIPSIGAKYYLKKEKKVKSYVALSLSKPMVRGKLSQDGTQNKDFNEDLKKTKLFGGELGFGVEYFLDENFSLAGEFGFRFIRAKLKNSYDNPVYDPSTGLTKPTQRNVESKLNMAPTYSRISFNFYFNNLIEKKKKVPAKI